MLCSIVLLALIQCSHPAPPAAPRTKYTDVIRTVTALEDLLGWARAHHDKLILDFMFSLRVAQGELELLSERASSIWGTELNLRIKLLQNRADKLVDLTLHDEGLTSNEYFSKFETMINTKYYVSRDFPQRRSFDTLPQREAAPSPDITFNEHESDNCMVQIFGNKDVAGCTFTMKCFDQMTDDNSEEYQLTHQLLYFILARLRGCEGELEVLARSKGSTIQQLLEKFMLKMYSRLSSILDQGQYDLFAEMVMIGQMLNYEEFYDAPLLELIYTWQDTTGCYRDEGNETDLVYLKTRAIGRRLLADETIDEYCSEHFTAIALICLCLMLNQQTVDLSRLLNRQTWHFPRLSLPSSYLAVLAACALALLLYLLKFRKLKFISRFFT